MSGGATLDWGDGDYGPTATALQPAATVALDALGLRAGEHLIDVGCGTGNALVEAARRGVRVAGFDPSARLAERASARLAGLGLAGDVRVGSAETPPEGIEPADAVVSVFAVIFSDEPERALRGMAGLCRPGGRLALTSWLPTGAIAAAGRVVRAALPAPAAATDPPRWHEPGWIAELLEAAGARDVTITEHELVFRDASPDAWFADQEARHPVWRAARGAVGEDAWPALRAESLAVLRDQNEDPSAFAVTSGYVVVCAAR